MKPLKVRSSWGVLIPLFSGGLVVTACGMQNPANWEVAGESSLGSLSVDSEPVVIVVMAPNDLPSCQNILAGWDEWRRRDETHFRLLLTRAPSALEKRILLSFGVRPDGVLSRGGPPSGATPAEYVVDGGEVVFRALRVRQSPLQRALKDGTLDEFVVFSRLAAFAQASF